MDMSEVAYTQRPGKDRRAIEASDAIDAERWRDLVRVVGSEIAAPLTAALERVHALTTTGQIDRANLRALREELEAARQSGMLAQQLARFSSGRMRVSHERLSLSATVNDVLTHRARETHARGIVLRPTLKAVDVIVDPSLLFSLLNTLLDWSMLHTRSTIEFSIDLKTWPAHAVLQCRFAHRPIDEPLPHAAGPTAQEALDNLHWHLIGQTALAIGLTLARSIDRGQVSVTLEFPRTVNDEIEGVSTIELDQGFALSTNSKPLAGSHVLIVASRREMRARVRNAIRHMGMLVDLVSSVEEAADFCREGLPHAIIVEGILRGEKLNQLRREIGEEIAEFPFIEIAEEGTAFEMSGFGGSAMGRVGRDAIENALPSVLMFELSRATQ